MIHDLFFVGIGAVLFCILDKLWNNPKFNKYEKGFEIFEHYIWGIVFVGTAIIFEGIIGSILLGAGFVLIFHEIHQNHPFSYGSNHFVKSTTVSITFIIVFILLNIWI